MHVSIIETRHDEFSVEFDCFRVGFPACAFRQDLGDGADTGDIVSAYGHGRGPGLLRIVGVNAPMQIKNGARSSLRGVSVRPERHERCACDDQSED